MAICARCGEFMKPSCDKCGTDLIEKEVIRKFIKKLRSHYKESDIAMAWTRSSSAGSRKKN